jgi:inhibitor of cysteine peptidase
MALTGCGSSREIALGAEDDGTSIELEQGQTLAITLESNPTTGYGWARDPTQTDDVLVQVGEPEYKSKSNLIGGGGAETLRFRAEAPGETTLSLVYRRPWEEDAKPAQTYTLVVSVR